uniref:PIN domain-containing protein n=1 Tax=Paenibacillus athensensis TaxID=1967502 RepID=A0A4Y8Q1Q9_9BACL
MTIASNEPLVRILCDTNVLVSAFILRSEQLVSYLDNLINQHENGWIEFVIPKAVQAELYGILRAGRIQSRKKAITLSHEQIMYLLEPYLGVLFDRDYWLVWTIMIGRKGRHIKGCLLSSWSKNTDGMIGDRLTLKKICGIRLSIWV